MPIQNKIFAIAAFSALITAPSFADGLVGKQVNRGPAPLQAHTKTPPRPGCILIEGNTWSCPTEQVKAPVTTTRTVTSTAAAPAAPTSLSLDLASFSGGVGGGVDGGFYGGGGGIYIANGSSYSGVLSHSASAFTFRQRSRRGGGGGGGGGGSGPCGCS